MANSLFDNQVVQILLVLVAVWLIFSIVQKSREGMTVAESISSLMGVNASQPSSNLMGVSAEAANSAQTGGVLMQEMPQPADFRGYKEAIADFNPNLLNPSQLYKDSAYANPPSIPSLTNLAENPQGVMDTTNFSQSGNCIVDCPAPFSNPGTPEGVDYDSIFARTGLDAADLVPKGSSDVQAWAANNPMGEATLNNVFLETAWSVGQPTISLPKRNFSNDIRGIEPNPIGETPAIAIGTTLPDLSRRRLEIV